MAADNILHQHLAKEKGSYFLNEVPPNRATGLSTGIALEALGRAMQNPTSKIYIVDHAALVNLATSYYTQLLAVDIIAELKLVGFRISKDHMGYYVVYNLYPDAK